MRKHISPLCVAFVLMPSKWYVIVFNNGLTGASPRPPLLLPHSHIAYQQALPLPGRANWHASTAPSSALSASASSLESSVACQARNLCAQIGNYCDCDWERGAWNRDCELELELVLTYLGASARFWLKSKNSQQIAPAVVRMYLTDTFLYTAQLYYVCNKWRSVCYIVHS